MQFDINVAQNRKECVCVGGYDICEIWKLEFGWIGELTFLASGILCLCLQKEYLVAKRN